MAACSFVTPCIGDGAAAALRRLDDSPLALTLTSLDVPDEDWARRSQANLTAITVGRITVAPPWDVPDAASRHRSGSRIPIRHRHESRIPDPRSRHDHCHRDRSLDGLRHRTPSDDAPVPRAAAVDSRSQDARLIDVGTGSGVLAIAAAKLGAAVGHGDGQRSRRASQRARERRAQRRHRRDRPGRLGGVRGRAG